MTRIIILLVAIAVSLPAMAQKMTKNTKVSSKSYVIKLKKAIKGERKIRTGMLTWQCKGNICKASTTKFSKSYCTQAKSQVGSYSYCGVESGLGSTGSTNPPRPQPATFTPVTINTPRLSVVAPAPAAFNPITVNTPRISVIAPAQEVFNPVVVNTPRLSVIAPAVPQFEPKVITTPRIRVIAN